MAFSLLENSFAVLGLAVDASAAFINERARSVGGDKAANAARKLMAPRTRLQEEVAFLPGVGASEVPVFLSTLAGRATPDLAGLLPVTQANLLAHAAAAGLADTGQLRRLLDLQADIGKGLREALAESRRTAAMPLAPENVLAEALERLSGDHADAMGAGFAVLPDNGAALLKAVRGLGGEIGPPHVFMRRAVAAWDRGVAARIAEAEEKAEELDTRLGEKPTIDRARELARWIAVLGAFAAPADAVNALFGLPADKSRDLSDHWRVRCIRLTEEHPAFAEAAEILRTLKSAFPAPDDGARARVLKDLEFYESKVASGTHLPQIQRLLAAIEAARANPKRLDAKQLRLLAFGPEDQTVPLDKVNCGLVDAFRAAIVATDGDRPFVALRNLAVEMFNAHSLLDVALALIDFALACCGFRPSRAEIRVQLEQDRKLLLRKSLYRDMTPLLQAKKWGKARDLAKRLLEIAEDTKEKADLQDILRDINAKLFGRGARFLFWGCVAAGFIFVLINGTANKPRNGGTYAASAAVSGNPGVVSSPPAYSPPQYSAESDFSETKPTPGTQRLGVAELRWCQFETARLESARGLIERFRSDGSMPEGAFRRAVGRFNDRVDAWNAVCLQTTYYERDKALIERQIAAVQLRLNAEGADIVTELRHAPDPFAASAPTAPAYAPPVLAAPASSPAPAYTPQPSVPPPRTTAETDGGANPSFADGQRDRREWEEWFASLGAEAQPGAEWWAGVRSNKPQPSCAQLPAHYPPAARTACIEARSRLGKSDARRRTDPAYRAGWNHI